MAENGDHPDGRETQKVTVEAPDIEGVAAALGMEVVEEPASGEGSGSPDEIRDVLEPLAG